MDYEKLFNIIEKKDVTQEYKAIVKSFIESKMAEGLSLYSLKARVSVLFQVIKWLDNKPLSIFKEDTAFNSYVAHMKLCGLKDSTINTNQIIIKVFLVWHFKKDTPDYLNNIKYKKSRRQLIENNLIKPSEIKLMVEKASNARDKALIITLYESAARISELLNVRVKDVEFREQETILKICTSKTKPREVPLFDSTQYLIKWLNEHPFKNNQDAYVFISLATNYYGHQLYSPTVGNRLKIYAKQAGVNKHLHCHLLRHSRISWWAKAEKLNERDLRLLCGWSEKSDMPNTYIHYNIDGVLEKMKQHRGIAGTKEIEQEKEQQALKPTMCPRCNKENAFDSMFCNCGMALNHKSIIQLEKIRNAEQELQSEILNRNIAPAGQATDIKEAMYQVLRSDPELVKKLKEIIDLASAVTQ